METQNKLHMLFSEEVAPPYQLPISGFKLHSGNTKKALCTPYVSYISDFVWIHPIYLDLEFRNCFPTAK